MDRRPNNGTKTHPMGTATLRAYAALKDGAVPKASLNPGVVDRLLREGTVDLVLLPSPYKTHKGKAVTHVRLIEKPPPAGDPVAPKLYVLTERNSWERERWNFFVRMTEDQAKGIRELIAGDSRYSLAESPLTEEEVRTRVENSLCRGYMPCWNDVGTLLRVPERVGDHPADQLYKGRIAKFCREAPGA